MEQVQERVDYEALAKAKLETALENLVDALNGMGSTKANKETVKDAFRRQHRTLQQQFVKVVVLGVLEQLDEAHTSGRTDLRNQDSAEMAHKMLTRVPEEERYLGFV